MSAEFIHLSSGRTINLAAIVDYLAVGEGEHVRVGIRYYSPDRSLRLSGDEAAEFLRKIKEWEAAKAKDKALREFPYHP
jgi:hypothetical protein